MIRIRELRKSYGAIRAVDGISLEFKPGETLGLLGPNGAGKTTIIHILIGATRADSGSIELDGVPDPRVVDARRWIGLAPQVLSLYGELTAEENLRFFGRLYGLSGKRLEERVGWALELAGLADRRGDRVDKYSGGMARRLNLACAIVHDPPFLLLDEPTVGVDPQSRNHIFEKIEALKRDGRTILYTTHYMEEAQRLCDRVAIMDHGRILALGTVNDLIREYGGRSVVEAVLVRLPAPSVALPGTLDGLRLRFETERPLEDVARLTAGGVEFAMLNVHRPDLETVFLALTGRRLRD
ncbi:MAG: ABC transporter ATP-binding protein [Acidobacteriota bacterium]